ncbi:MAG: hypothetical protein K6L73_06115 [Cellvibrionaceae bacterium]
MNSNWNLENFSLFSDFQSWLSPDSQHLNVEQNRLKNRVVSQLDGWTNQELRDGCLFVDKMMKGYFTTDRVFDHISKVMVDELVDVKYQSEWESLEGNYDPFVASYLYFLSSSEGDSLSEYSWSEIFAILALNCLAEAVIDSNYEAVQGGSSDTWHYNDTDYKRLACEARALFIGFDLISVSERLSSHAGSMLANIEEEARKKLSEQNRNNIEKRYELSREIKKRFVEYFNGLIILNPSIKKSEAARNFYINELNDIEKREITPSLERENAVRTLTQVLRTPEKYI